MAIAFRASATPLCNKIGSVNGTITANSPAGVVAGDVLIAKLAYNNSITPGTPSGWTQIGTTISIGTLGYSEWYRVATGSGDTFSVACSNSGSSAAFAVTVDAYSGVDNTTPINASALGSELSGTATTSHTTPTITTTVANCWIVEGVCDKGSPSSQSWTLPSGFTNRGLANSGTNAYPSLESTDSNGPVAAGSHGGDTYTGTLSTTTAAMSTIALQPAATGGSTAVTLSDTATGNSTLTATASAALADSATATEGFSVSNSGTAVSLADSVAGSEGFTVSIAGSGTSLTNDFEGTSGTAPAATSAGGPSPFDTTTVSGTGAALTYDNTITPHSGSTSARLDFPANVGAQIYCRWFGSDLPATSNAYARFYVYITANPTALTRIGSFMSSATLKSSVSISTAGRLVGPVTSGASLPLNTWVRIEHEILNMNGTTADINVRAYTGDGSTLITTASQTGVAVTGNSINEYRVGAANTTTQTAAYSMRIDDAAYSDTAQPGAMSAPTAISLADTVTGTEGFSVTNSGSTVSLADTATGTEAMTVQVTTSLADTGTGTEALSNGYGITLADTATGSETASYPFRSGAWVAAGASPQNFRDFGTWRGRPLDIAHTYITPKTSWTSLQSVSPAMAFQGTEFATDYRLMISLVPIPNDGTSTMAALAAGTYDTQVTTIATNLLNAGLDEIIVRNGWEFNLKVGSCYYSCNPNTTGAQVCTAADYVAGIQRMVTLFRAVSSKFRFEWCPSATYQGFDVTTAYPGDAYVDYIGFDSYDTWYNHSSTSITPQQRWNQWLNDSADGGNGVGAAGIASFAAAHNKPMGIGEWGLSNPAWNTNGGSDDDSYFMDQFYDWCIDNLTPPGALFQGFECYFESDTNTGTPDATTGNFNLQNSVWPKPNAAAEYQTLWPQTFASTATVSLSDTATATETFSAANGATPISLADTGSGVDALATAATATLTETAAAADALTMAASAHLAEAGTGADTVAAAATTPLADTGHGTDAATVASASPVADIGTGTEALSATVLVTLSDTATWSESFSGANTGTAVSFAETGSSADALATSAAIHLADTGTGADALAASSSAPLADTASAAELTTVSAHASLADTGTGTEGFSVVNSGTAISLADTGTGADALAATTSAHLADTGTGTEALTVTVTAALADTATSIEGFSGGNPSAASRFVFANGIWTPQTRSIISRAMPPATAPTRQLQFNNGDVALGSWPSNGSAPAAYPTVESYSDGTGSKYYPSQVLSVDSANEVLDWYCHNSQAAVALPFGYDPFTYGTFSLDIKFEPFDGYHIAFLFWPTSNQWTDEIDFPESNTILTAPYMAVLQDPTTSKFLPAGTPRTPMPWNDGNWHNYTVDWRSSYVRGYQDGLLFAEVDSPDRIPAQSMRWTLQVEWKDSSNTPPDPSLNGHVQVRNCRYWA